jgi:hypothetical protein
MKELCKKDDEHNRGENVNPNRPRNIFTVEEIRGPVLGAFSLQRVILGLRGHILENRDNEPLELLNNEIDVRLTDAGRAMMGAVYDGKYFSFIKPVIRNSASAHRKRLSGVMLL